MHRAYQPSRRNARVTGALLGAAIGLGLVATVIEGMAARSGGQSLGQFVAAQRAVTAQPLAQVTTPAAQATAAPAVARDAV